MPLFEALYAENDATGVRNIHMIDLSDTTNWPHKSTTKPIFVRRVWAVGELLTAGAGTIRVGTVTNVNSTNGDVAWFFVLPIDSPGKFSHSQSYSEDRFYADGINPYRVGTSTTGQLMFISTNDNDADSTQWQTDVTLAERAALGAAVAPAVNDIVAEITEDSAITGISVTIALLYSQ